MTVLQKKSDNPIAHLSTEDIESIGLELDARATDLVCAAMDAGAHAGGGQ